MALLVKICLKIILTVYILWKAFSQCQLSHIESYWLRLKNDALMTHNTDSLFYRFFPQLSACLTVELLRTKGQLKFSECIFGSLEQLTVFNVQLKIYRFFR